MTAEPTPQQPRPEPDAAPAMPGSPGLCYPPVGNGIYLNHKIGLGGICSQCGRSFKRAKGKPR